MRSLLVEAKELVGRFAAGLDPATITCRDASALLDDLIGLERSLAALKLRLVPRVEESPEWKQQGFRSPEEWLARKHGTGLHNATRMFETGRQLADLPNTADALAAGELSGEQVAVVAGAAAADPSAEQRLIDVARRDGLVGVRREAERVKAAAMDERKRYERIHRGRHFGERKGGDGACVVFGSFAPDVGAALMTEVRKEADRLFDEARRAGRRETQPAYMADALANLVLGTRTADSTGGGDRKQKPPPRIDRTVFVRIDGSSLESGHLLPGDTCEVVGGGPVPVGLVRSWCTDANLRLLLMKGDDVQKVVHLGRQLTEAQRTALYERARFCCEVEGCTVTHGLEIDHVADWHLTQRTRLEDLMLVCRHDHHLKTYRGYTVEGPPGKRRLVPPPAPPPGTDPSPADGARPSTARAGLQRARDTLQGVVDRAGQRGIPQSGLGLA